jgi:hypothetical protein
VNPVTALELAARFDAREMIRAHLVVHGYLDAEGGHHDRMAGP